MIRYATSYSGRSRNEHSSIPSVARAFVREAGRDPDVAPIIDFYHAASRLRTVSRAVQPTDAKAKRWANKWIKSLYNGKITALLRELQRHARQLGDPPEQCKQYDPPQDRVRCEQRADLSQQPAAKYLSLDGQAATLIVTEQNTLFAEFLSEYLVLAPKIRYNLMLLTIDPAGKKHEEDMPRLQDEAHYGPDRKAEMAYHVVRNANSQGLGRLKSQIQACHKLRAGRLLWSG